MQASLHVMVGKQKGREIPLPGTFFIIGRDALCHLRPHSSMVSRRHCAIAWWGGRILVRDLKSANGTFLNHRRITSQVEVHDGDVLDVGGLTFTFHISKDEAEPLQDPMKDLCVWLMREPNDSDVLDPGMATAMFQLSTQAFACHADDDAEETNPDGSRNLSAGKYLRDYLGVGS
jgi:pSer/pThr/pTyr-binding forkhead associated (FHA) protein